MRNLGRYILLSTICLMLGNAPAGATEQAQEWELLVPTGVVYKPSFDPAPRPTTLDGKTVVLRWNSKPNGDVLLDYLAEKLAEKAPSAKIIKAYREHPEINIIPTSYAASSKLADVVLGYHPDLVIESSGD